MLNLFSFWIKLLFSPHLIISFIYWISYSVLTNNDIEQNSLNRVYWTFLNSCAPLLLLILDHVYCSSCSIERMMLLFNVCEKKKINFLMSLAHSKVDRVDFFLTKRGMHRRKCSLSIIALLGFLQMPLRSHVGSLVTITQWKTFFLDLYCYKHQCYWVLEPISGGKKICLFHSNLFYLAWTLLLDFISSTVLLLLRGWCFSRKS